MQTIQKSKLGVSSCLLGTNCRYDGSHNKDEFIIDILSKYFDFVPYCPEAMIFPTPRETIRLVEIDGQTRVFTTKSTKEFTLELDGISNQLALDVKNHDICGFILKAKSPSCGLERVKVYQDKGHLCEKKGVGRFANQLKIHYPNLPLEEEARLIDPWLKENFLMQIFAYKDLQEFLNNNPKFKDLVQFHTDYKYLIYSKSQKAYKQLGNIVANHEHKDFASVLKEYKKAFEEVIAQKSNISKTYNVLLHIFGYFKKDISKDEKEIVLGAMNEYKNKIIPLISIIKLIKLYIKKFDIKYLKSQKFLSPYPDELALRSDIRAYK